MFQVKMFHPGLCGKLETIHLTKEGVAEVEAAVRRTTRLLPTDPVRVSDLLIALRDRADQFVAVIGKDKADRLVRILQELGFMVTI